MRRQSISTSRLAQSKRARNRQTEKPLVEKIGRLVSNTVAFKFCDSRYVKKLTYKWANKRDITTLNFIIQALVTSGFINRKWRFLEPFLIYDFKSIVRSFLNFHVGRKSTVFFANYRLDAKLPVEKISNLVRINKT